MRYLDRVAPGPALSPPDPKAAARMDQAMAIVDSYAYPSIITKLVMQRIVAPMMGGTPDEAVIKDALPNIRTCLGALDRIMSGRPFLAGAELSLADLLLAPVFAYFTQTPEAGSLLPLHAGLHRWWHAMAERPSMARTAPRFG
jgi:glutathione S-transferase